MIILDFINVKISPSINEMKHWTSKVDSYVNVIENQIKKQGMLLYGHHLDTRMVSHLHTGSIPSQFGKPLMILSELPISVIR